MKTTIFTPMFLAASSGVLAFLTSVPADTFTTQGNRSPSGTLSPSREIADTLGQDDSSPGRETRGLICADTVGKLQEASSNRVCSKTFK